MTRLEDTGIGVTPFMNPRDVLGVPLEIVGARHRDGTTPQGAPVTQVAYDCRIVDMGQGLDWYQGDGDDLIPHAFTVTLTAGDYRNQYVAWFLRNPGGSIGPVEFAQLPGKNGLSGAYTLLPYGLPIDAPSAPAAPVAVPNGRSVQESLPPPTTRPAAAVQNGGTVSRSSTRQSATRQRANAPVSEETLDDLPF